MQSKQSMPITSKQHTITTSSNTSVTLFQPSAPAASQQLARAIQPPMGVERSAAVCGELTMATSSGHRRLSAVCLERPPQQNNSSRVPFHPAQAETGSSLSWPAWEPSCRNAKLFRPGRRRPRRQNHNRRSTMTTYHNNDLWSATMLSTTVPGLAATTENPISTCPRR